MKFLDGQISDNSHIYSLRIHYEDNRRKGKSWDIELTNNKFIMLSLIHI